MRKQSKISCHFSAMRKRPYGKFRGWRILAFYLALRAAVQVLKTLSGLEQIKFPRKCQLFCHFLEVHVVTSFLETALCALCCDTRGSLCAGGQHFVPPFTSHRHPAKAKALWPMAFRFPSVTPEADASKLLCLNILRADPKGSDKNLESGQTTLESVSSWSQLKMLQASRL